MHVVVTVFAVVVVGVAAEEIGVHAMEEMWQCCRLDPAHGCELGVRAAPFSRGGAG